MEKYWPIVLPLPRDPYDRRKILLTIFSSPIIVEVLRLFEPGKKLYQKDIINSLRRHSNRTIINYLKRLVESEILSEGIEKIRSGTKTVYVKYYTLTDLGVWFNMLFKSPSELSAMELKRAILSLYDQVTRRIISDRETFSITGEEVIRQIIMSAMESYIAESGKLNGEFDVIVLGSVAVDYFVERSGSIHVKLLLEAPGGSGANVAVNLARLGRKTCFIGKMACDYSGLKCIESFIREGVYVNNVILDKWGATVKVVIGLEGGRNTITCLISENSTLSPLPGEISEDTLRKLVSSTKAMYVGEVFNEVAERAMRIASGEVEVYYRPLIEALRMRFAQTMNLIKYSPTIILNKDKWLIVKDKGFDSPTQLLDMGARRIIITLGEEGALVVEKDIAHHIKPPPVKPLDPTGAGDCFAAHLIHGVLDGKTVVEATRRAVAAASLSTLEIGGRASVPKEENLSVAVAKTCVLEVGLSDLDRILGD